MQQREFPKINIENGCGTSIAVFHFEEGRGKQEMRILHSKNEDRMVPDHSVSQRKKCESRLKYGIRLVVLNFGFRKI